MAIKKYKGVTPGRRQMSIVDYSGLSKRKPQRRLTSIKSKITGRGASGTISIRHRGGGHKRRYRDIDFKQIDKIGIPGKVTAIEYDPNRSSFIALTVYADGEKRYHLASADMKAGDTVLTKEKVKVKSGNRMMLKNIPVGYNIYNVELTRGKGGQIVRSAGSTARIVACEGPLAQIELPSGEVRYVDRECYATIGTVSNPDHSLVKIGKAGRSRWMGRRPEVRGKAMNPVDHPHGGGEGGSPIGMVGPKTKWGMPALGFKTRKRKYSDYMIVSDRRKKKKS